MHAQLTLSLLPPVRADLADGMVGRNQEALASLAALLERREADFLGAGSSDSGFSANRPPWLLLWGEPGCGKSFWLEAWSHARPDCQLVSPVTSSGHGALTLREATTHDQDSALLADDVDRWPEEMQHALFAYMAAQAGLPAGQMRPVVMTSQAPAARLTDLREDLRTRLGLALSFELHRLSETDMMSAMRQQAHALGWVASAEQTDFDRLFEYLLTRLPRHLGALKALMKKADEKALAEKRSLTLPLVRSLMDELFDTLSEPTTHA
jgi:DnaA family protein